jgi:hypothetical protein
LNAGQFPSGYEPALITRWPATFGRVAVHRGAKS